ncbi:hypothetical protein EOT10_03180 [Streptomyces antnestii]|uniref:Uncharacterized protein n=1 Tax=Streptomyces antnestii TaxID=2494256 RepID=A0A3S2Z417_9ACTN|nr:hypothetical protein EOT10_03180 [Streptomyces sp. San01]
MNSNARSPKRVNIHWPAVLVGQGGNHARRPTSHMANPQETGHGQRRDPRPLRLGHGGLLQASRREPRHHRSQKPPASIRPRRRDTRLPQLRPRHGSRPPRRSRRGGNPLRAGPRR